MSNRELTHHSINYVELPAADLAATKLFFSGVFNWQFTDYGPDYTAFSNATINGGFYHAPLVSDAAVGAALVVIYSADLEQTQHAVEQAGGQVCKAIFSFPGGRRFHFKEPSGNEFAVWSDKGSAEI
ncbi:VOC family protein [Neiella marina]|uniref:VOC family protein n=1 Tax=Neiella holothuriorum TaxID=2870530 RepID=A0ABS7EHT2_9GAMM|nr:VOC family protein [Neiella holothuriorum]MBW8191896.1 VOC family protein [Neiella holothuriorum]